MGLCLPQPTRTLPSPHVIMLLFSALLLLPPVCSYTTHIRTCIYTFFFHSSLLFQHVKVSRVLKLAPASLYLVMGYLMTTIVPGYSVTSRVSSERRHAIGDYVQIKCQGIKYFSYYNIGKEKYIELKLYSK